MTGRYAWNLLPSRLDVICPASGGAAEFAFARFVTIRRRDDVAQLGSHPHLSCQRMEGRSGQRHHIAVFFSARAP